MTNHVKVIKGKSSFLFNKSRHVNKANRRYRLWFQKFFFANLDNWEIAKHNISFGFKAKSTYLETALHYIENNRIKHGLERNEELENIIESFVKRTMG